MQILQNLLSLEIKILGLCCKVVFIFSWFPYIFWSFVKSSSPDNQGVIQNIFLGSGSTHKKQVKICIEYTFISEFRLHRGNFVNVKWVKIPSLAALQVAKYIKTIKKSA